MTSFVSRCTPAGGSSRVDLATGFRRCLGAVAAIVVASCGADRDTTGMDARVARQRQALVVAPAVIGTDPPAAIQYSTGGYLSVASSGDQSLVVFYDGGEIRGMRYDAQGQLLDLEQWLQLGRNDDDTGAHAYTDVAYGDGVYLALFSDSTEGARGVAVQAVTSDGTVLGPPVLAGPDAYYGSVVFNGVDFTVAFSNGNVGLVRVGLDGQLIPGTEVYVTSLGKTNRPVLALLGDVGLVAFEQEVDGVRRVYAARFDATGSVLDPEGFLVSDATTSSVDVSVAAGSDEFAVVWTAGSAEGVVGSMVGLDGAVSQREFPISSSGTGYGGSAVAHDGEQYFVAFQSTLADGGAIAGTRLTSQGERVDDVDAVLASPARAFQSWDIDMVWANGRYHLDFVGDGVQGRFVDSELNVLDPGPLELSALPSAQNVPTAAWNGNAYVLGWSDERDPAAFQFRAGRIDDAGNRLDPDGIALSRGGDSVGNVGVASNGQSTLFTWRVWGDEPELYKRVLNAEGQLSEAESWWTGADGGYAVSSNGQRYLAAFTRGDNGVGNDNEIWGQVFDEQGQTDGEPALLVTVSRPRYGLHRFGDEHLLLYSGQQPDGTPITGAVLTLDGDARVTAEYEPVVEGMLTASVGASDEQVLFTWRDDSDALWGRILNRDDGLGAPFSITEQAVADAGAIAWDGNAFVVVWAERRTAMWTRTIAADGAMTEPERLFGGDYGWLGLTPGPDGQMLLSYVRWLEWSRSRRVESRIVGALGEGWLGDPLPEPEDGLLPPSDDTRDVPEEETPPDAEAPATPEQGAGGPAGAPTTPGAAPTPTDDGVVGTDATGMDASPSASGPTDAPEGAAPALADDDREGDGDGSGGGLLCATGGPGKNSGGAGWLLGALVLQALARFRRRPSGARASRSFA